MQGRNHGYVEEALIKFLGRRGLMKSRLVSQKILFIAFRGKYWGKAQYFYF